jgi:preprotein translocase subunit SecF
MLQVFTHANFPLMGRTRWYFFSVSILASLVAAYAIIVVGFNYGIDFVGGTAVQVKFRERPPIDEMRAALEKAGLGDISIQSIGAVEDNEVLIRVELRRPRAGQAEGEGGDVSARVLEALKSAVETGAGAAGKIDLNMASEAALEDWLAQRLPSTAGDAAAGGAPNAAAIAKAITAYRTEHEGLLKDLSELGAIPGLPAEAVRLLQTQATPGRFTLRSVEFVGPTAGKELLQNTALAILLSVAGILSYVWFRFHKWVWGLAAIIALVHDVLIAAGAVALTGKEFSLPVVAALLTILGYSINDTIVVFDRIRENLRLYRDQDFVTVVNASVNQTLSRTVLTSFTVFIAITALYLYGGDKLNPLSFCLLVGVVFGTYSSIFVASALLVVAYHRFGAKLVKA